MSTPHEPDRPFRAVVPNPSAEPPTPESPELTADDGDWSADDLEAAYLRALEVAESAEASFEEPDTALAGDESEWVDAADVELVVDEVVEATELAAQADAGGQLLGSSESADETVDGSDEAAAAAPISPRQIVEALLFVGGHPLTARQLADVLGGSLGPEQVEDFIASLNQSYTAQQRPYEVRLGDGGYRLELRSDFEKVRAKVYGQGPKEVRLSQDTLEVLAFIAYRQPVAKEDFAETGKEECPGCCGNLFAAN
ncbi:MAG: SMC-Scp complex subunit ScpB [Planctomycetaceae bacterium]